MFSIRMDGDIRPLIKKLHILENVDTKVLNKALGQVTRESTLERFKTQTDPEGKKWKQSKRAAREGGSTLTKTARLKNSIKVHATQSGFAVGTNTIYAATHQKGDKNRVIRAKKSSGLLFKFGDRWVRKQQVKMSIPARPFLGLNDDDRLEIKHTIEDFVEGLQ